MKKGKYFQPSNYIELEEFQKNDEVRQEREKEIQSEIEELEETVKTKINPLRKEAVLRNK